MVEAVTAALGISAADRDLDVPMVPAAIPVFTLARRNGRSSESLRNMRTTLAPADERDL